MFNVTVTFLKGNTIHMKNYAEVADNECIAMQKALLECKKEYQCGHDDMKITDIEEV